MGNCVSTVDREAAARSQEIDKQIEEDSRKFKKECKILLLGKCSSMLESPKRTVGRGAEAAELGPRRVATAATITDSAELAQCRPCGPVQ